MAFMGAIGGPQLAMMSVAMGVMGAASKMNEARATAYQYQAQATQTELQGRLEAVKARQEGNQVLETMNAVIAATTARSSAGGLSPFSAGESVDLINTYSMRQGVTEFSISRDNAAIAEDMSKYQAGIYRTAAANTMKAARTNAMMSVMGSVMKAGQLYPTDGFTNMFLPSGNVPAAGGFMQVN